MKISIGKYTPLDIPQGCADSGFCFSCKVIVGDHTCFCWGGNCPKCGQRVNPRTVPKDLDGIYEKYYTYGNPSCIKLRYEKGQFKERLK